MYLKAIIKKFIPKKLLAFYHFILAKIAKWLYLNPSNRMFTIGITGTSGKSSTCYFTAQILNYAGIKTGMISTTLINNGQKEWLNDKKMTMLGRLQSQKILRKMYKNNCRAAVVETTSQGIEQFRHIGINYDILVLTNLYPEHIEAHGDFENYKQAKGKLFKHLTTQKYKTFKGLGTIKKTIIANLDDEYSNYFLSFKADRKIGYTKKNKQQNMTLDNKRGKNDIDIDNKIFYNDKWKFNLLGEYNKYNLLAAIAVTKELGLDEQTIAQNIDKLKPLPGRLEFIKNDLNIKILIDYAFEPKALEHLYNTLKSIEYNRVIHILGSTGGGRDKDRRPKLGKIAADLANIVIVTNEDPYDENPKKIIDQVAKPVPQDKLYKISDRRQAIHQALELAHPGDLIIVTGKGAEQAICIESGKKIKWDDRLVVKEELAKIKN